MGLSKENKQTHKTHNEHEKQTFSFVCTCVFEVLFCYTILRSLFRIFMFGIWFKHVLWKVVFEFLLRFDLESEFGLLIRNRLGFFIFKFIFKLNLELFIMKFHVQMSLWSCFKVQFRNLLKQYCFYISVFPNVRSTPD